jgi:nucleotide sugar dehydrogenase
MRIGVIGLGHVGHSVVTQFSGHDVVTYDILDRTPYPSEALASCDVAMICVDTPARHDGSADVSRVEAALAQLPCRTVLLRSTVPPGTTERLTQLTGKDICFWPEYVGETHYLGGSWEQFAARDPFVILGGEAAIRRRMIDLLQPTFGPQVRFFQCSSREAELVKYMENSYFAAKITFVNEFRLLSERLGVDWHTVREGWLLDPRVERDHSVAFADQRGFDGKCLPKDLAAILRVAEDSGLQLKMLEAVQDANRDMRRTGGS